MTESELQFLRNEFEKNYHPHKVKRNEADTKYIYYQTELEYLSFVKGWQAHSKFLAMVIVKASDGRPNSAGYSYAVADMANNETPRPD